MQCVPMNRELWYMDLDPGHSVTNVTMYNQGQLSSVETIKVESVKMQQIQWNISYEMELELIWQ